MMTTRMYGCVCVCVKHCVCAHGVKQRGGAAHASGVDALPSLSGEVQ